MSKDPLAVLPVDGADESLTAFLDKRRLAELGSAVRIDPKALDAPDETAFQCLLRAQALIAQAHPLSPEEQSRRAAGFEFHTGRDMRTVRDVVETYVPSSAGGARFARLTTEALNVLLSFEPDSCDFAATAKDEPIALGGAPREIGEAAYDDIRGEGISPVGAAVALVLVAMRRAKLDGANPWQRVRVLVEMLEDTLLEIPVAANRT